MPLYNRPVHRVAVQWKPNQFVQRVAIALQDLDFCRCCLIKCRNRVIEQHRYHFLHRLVHGKPRHTFAL